MNFNLDDLFSEEISDEAAYQIVHFFMELHLALESKYFVQLKRYDADQPKPDWFRNDDITNPDLD